MANPYKINDKGQLSVDGRRKGAKQDNFVLALFQPIVDLSIYLIFKLPFKITIGVIKLPFKIFKLFRKND